MLLGVSTLGMLILGYISFWEGSARQTSATAEPFFLVLLSVAAIQLIRLIVRVLMPEEVVQVLQRAHERKPPQE